MVLLIVRLLALLAVFQSFVWIHTELIYHTHEKKKIYDFCLILL